MPSSAGDHCLGPCCLEGGSRTTCYRMTILQHLASICCKFNFLDAGASQQNPFHDGCIWTACAPLCGAMLPPHLQLATTQRVQLLLFYASYCLLMQRRASGGRFESRSVIESTAFLS